MNNNSPFRRVARVLLLALLLLSGSATTALARSAAIPLTIDYPLLTQLLVRAAFPERGNMVRLVNSRDGCLQLLLAEPSFSMKSGLLQLEIRIFSRAGTQLAGTCLSPIEWGGYLQLELKPVLNSQTFALSFRIINSRLLSPDRRPAEVANVLWEFAQPYIYKHLQGVAINLAPPVNDLKAFLLPIFPHQTQLQSRRMLDSFTTGEVRVGTEALTADLLIEVEEVFDHPGENPPMSLSSEEVQRAVKLWESWDSFLVQLISTLARQVLSAQEQDLLAEVLLDTRYAFVAALNENTVGQDFVRKQFVEAWAKLAPIFRRHLAEAKSDEILGFMAFFTAADALKAFDTMGPTMGVEVSRQGLLHLTTMLGGSEQSLNYVPTINPLLRNLLTLPPEEASGEPPFTETDIEVEPEVEDPPPPAEEGAVVPDAPIEKAVPGESPEEPGVAPGEDNSVPPPAEPSPPVDVPEDPPVAEADTPSPQAPDSGAEPLGEPPPPVVPDQQSPAPEQTPTQPQSVDPEATPEVVPDFEEKDLELHPLTMLLEFLCPPAAAANSSTTAEILQWRVPAKGSEAYLEKVRDMLAKAALKTQLAKNIPPEHQDMFATLIPAMAWQESCFRQFVQKGNKLSYLLSYNNTSVGIMQVNERIWRGIYDQNRLRWDIRYNAMAGAEIATLYMQKYALGKGGKKLRGDLLARAVYAMYNGGPGQLSQFLERERKNDHYKSDTLFREKLGWVRQDAWKNINRCL